MAAQWLEEMQANGIAWGVKVKFDLPTAMKLERVSGQWLYTPTAIATFEGEIRDIKQNRLTVYVASERRNCYVHPAMVKPVNVLVTQLVDVR